MNPSSNSSGYQPYFNQNASTSNNSSQQPNSQGQGQYGQSNNNALKVPQYGGYLNQGSTDNSLSVNKGKLDRVMYSSTIEPSTSSKPFGGGGFSKLESMGRFVGGEDSSKNNSQQFKPSTDFLSKPDKPKLASSFISPTHANQGNDFDRFPAFNIQEKSGPLQFKPKQPQSNSSTNSSNQSSVPGETPEQKRRRQIMAIKQQLSNINKKMESSNLNKKYLYDGQQNAQSSSSNSSNTDFNGGLGVPRNKGVISQSMIVSNEPLPGYKQQPSIFEKYESLKKPTYEANQKQEERPLGLDKFLNKGMSSEQKTEETNKGFSEPQSYGFNKFSTEKANSSSSGNETSGTGMFKKKAAYIEQNSGLTDFSKFNAISPKTSQSNTFQAESNANMFKKQKPVFEENLVTKAMKNMNVEESVDFKKDDFNVGKKLGKGQFGEVMVVQHKKTGFLCGMKVMEKKQIREQKYEGQITRELSIQFYLAHRNITPLYGYFQDELNVYLLIEYCTGGQLLEMLRKNRRMEEPEVSRIIKQIIEGIDYIHKELIIHRDIKPENILFNFGIAKICDFGWAVYKGHGMRKTASVGSPLYYSPEIVMGVEYDQKIDIWDIGMMTYECLLGKIPFRIYSELDLNRIVEDDIKFPEYVETTDEAKDFILKIMKKKPEERMQIREMLRHPFITKYQDQKLPIEIMQDFKNVLTG